MKRIRLVVYGTVQGVGFRWFVRQHARRLGLAGYVLNRSDGAVEVQAAGLADDIASLARTVAHGPAGAVVDRVEQMTPTDEPLTEPFSIRR